MKNLCVIPARGGSKRIPFKNVRNFCGWPIISYPIKQALESKLFDEVIVYTDNQEIAKVANEYGAITPLFRAQENANDTATLTETLFEVLIKYEDTDKWFDNICVILPTAVFITFDDLFNSKNRLDFDKLDSVISVNKYNHPIERAFEIDLSTGYLFMKQSGYEFSRTQDIMPSYHDAGQFYWLHVNSFLDQHKIFMKKMIGHQIDAVDIDNEEDWQLAELKYKLKKGLT
jgi:N-acylneuraminate cytidylyltransferase